MLPVLAAGRLFSEVDEGSARIRRIHSSWIWSHPLVQACLQPSHGGNRGSNPLGDAIFINGLVAIYSRLFHFPKRFPNRTRSISA